MREVDWKKMIAELESLARWLDQMAAMTREQDLKRGHKERAKAVRNAIEELEEKHELGI